MNLDCLLATARLLPPELAHRLAIHVLASGLWPKAKPLESPVLKQRLWNIEFPNPVGLAAGFDKNAEAVAALLHQGFGFVEAGTVTPRPQIGNPRPRMFRLKEDKAVINRLGFNNAGMEVFARHLKVLDHRQGVVGANVGKNRDSEDATDDYVRLMLGLAPYADYITVNISSPNTQGLRDLQQKEPLTVLLTALLEARAKLARHVPLLVKIAPDLDDAGLQVVAELALSLAIDGLIVSNTTVARPDSLKSRHAQEQGGLSGKPLLALSTERLAATYRLTQGRIPLIGVGGIASPEDAYAKIRAGASLVQLYTALAYQGFGLVRRINEGLIGLLKRDGFAHVHEAVGIDAK